MRCYDEAAQAFGWSHRSVKPGSMRDGDWLVGCASANDELCFCGAKNLERSMSHMDRRRRSGQGAPSVRSISNTRPLVAARRTAASLETRMGAVAWAMR